jgi:hypothetical protein
VLIDVWSLVSNSGSRRAWSIVRHASSEGVRRIRASKADITKQVRQQRQQSRAKECELFRAQQHHYTRLSASTFLLPPKPSESYLLKSAGKLFSPALDFKKTSGRRILLTMRDDCELSAQNVTRAASLDHPIGGR